ncbi:hypothetical protein PLCT2_00834 [Planctomycetaceae bacterium]|nr:hypothetical protein PLCT2_00834 [Planctomycetaceae bacterium]
MLEPSDSAAFDRAGILAVLGGVLLCALAAALPLLLLPQSSRCAKTHVESFCDEIAGLFGAASHDKTEAP